MPKTMTISCFNTRNFIFQTCHAQSYLNAVHHQLTYKEDDETSLAARMEDHSPEHNILACHLPSIAEEEDDDTEEHFPTISLDDDIWTEEQVPERHLCIHENHNMTCALTPAHTGAGVYITFPDVIVSTGNDDLPSLEDILGL